MGWLVEWHIPKQKFDFEILDTLPSGLRADVFRIDGCEFDLIHANFRSRRIFPLGLGDNHDKLNKLYESLIDAGVEIALNPQVVHLNLWLSNALQDEVISIESNDDQLDLAVQSKSGCISRLRFRAEDIEVLYENDEVHIFPLIPEMGEPMVDLEKFDVGSFIVHARDKEQTSELHEIAAEEINSFLGIEPQVIGLATWDFDEECLRRVFTGKNEDRNTAEDKTVGAEPQQDKQLSLTTRFTLMMSVVVAVFAFNAYREYEDVGQLDSAWYLSLGATIALVLIIFTVLAKRQ